MLSTLFFVFLCQDSIPEDLLLSFDIPCIIPNGQPEFSIAAVEMTTLLFPVPDSPVSNIVPERDYS
jgi:hypothetical protein